MDANRHSDMAGGDLIQLSDQLILDSWYLPPDGDQSWRAQDAQRIFGEDGKGEINDAGDHPPLSDGAEAGREEPVFETPVTIRILLPVAMATAVMFFVTALSAPEMLTARFWASPEPSAPAIAPATLIDAALPVQPPAQSLPEKLRPSMTDNETALEPGPMTGATAVNARIGQGGVTAEAPAPAAERPPQRAAPNQIRRTTRLAALKTTPPGPPPGQGAAAGPPAVPDAPISTAPPSDAGGATAADWKAKAAQWDKLANDIRARSGARSPDPAPSHADAPTATDWQAQAAQWDRLASAIRARSQNNRAAPAVP